MKGSCIKFTTAYRVEFFSVAYFRALIHCISGIHIHTYIDETNTLAGPICFDKIIDLGRGFLGVCLFFQIRGAGKKFD